MKIDVCSDLHEDAWFHSTRFYDPKNPPKYKHVYWDRVKSSDSEGLIIAGDTANSLDMTIDVVRDAAKEYDWVVVIDGNHEHYDTRRTIEGNVQYLHDYLGVYPHVHFLDGKVKAQVQIEDVLIVGALGWYDWKCYENEPNPISAEKARIAWTYSSNDSHCPRFDGKGPDVRAIEHSAELVIAVTEAQTNPDVRAIVVATHTSPHRNLMKWHPTDMRWNELTPSYCNTEMSQVLDVDTEKKIKYWIYGHTHARQMKDVDHVTFVNNARGYPRESSPWAPVQIEA